MKLLTLNVLIVWCKNIKNKTWFWLKYLVGDNYPANFSCDKDITAGTSKQQYISKHFYWWIWRETFLFCFKKYIYLHPHFIVKIYQEIIQFVLFRTQLKLWKNLFLNLVNSITETLKYSKNCHEYSQFIMWNIF